MDFATIIGLVLCVCAVVGSIFAGGDLTAFLDVPSMLVVGLGVTGATFTKWPLEVVSKVGKIGMRAVFFTPTDVKETIDEITNLAETARRESVFALEKQIIDNPFMKKAMNLASDNRPPEVINSILQMDINATEERHKVGIDLFQGLAEDGPAFGMIGTLIGLVIMLGNLSDQAAIGPAMAVALLTTFYGSCLANIVCNPIKNKLSIRSKSEITKMTIIVIGTLGIVSGENPRFIREKLNLFLTASEASSESDEEKREE